MDEAQPRVLTGAINGLAACLPDAVSSGLGDSTLPVRYWAGVLRRFLPCHAVPGLAAALVGQAVNLLRAGPLGQQGGALTSAAGLVRDWVQSTRGDWNKRACKARSCSRPCMGWSGGLTPSALPATVWTGCSGAVTVQWGRCLWSCGIITTWGRGGASCRGFCRTRCWGFQRACITQGAAPLLGQQPWQTQQWLHRIRSPGLLA